MVALERERLQTNIDEEPSSLPNIQLEELLGVVHSLTGCDFRHYSRASVMRRVRRFLDRHGLEEPSAAARWVQSDDQALADFVESMTVQVTEMFRDPLLFRLFRNQVVPILQSHPQLKFWIAGCCTGEEVLSLSILLREEGLEDRSMIYATDLSAASLEKARLRIYPVEMMRTSMRNYLEAGGKGSLSDYYLARYDRAIFDHRLHSNVCFARHNLATDGSLLEFTAIFCRNVMIYFDQDLRCRVFDLIHRSLHPLGYLALGDKEILRSAKLASRYELLDPKLRLYRRKY